MKHPVFLRLVLKYYNATLLAENVQTSISKFFTKKKSPILLQNGYR